MELHERLKELVGHEVIITTQLEDEESDVPGGVLQEVGVDYLIVRTEDEEKGGFAKVGAEWYVRLAAIVHLIHLHDCKKCVQDFVTKQVRTET